MDEIEVKGRDCQGNSLRDSRRAPWQSAVNLLASALTDPEADVRFFAARARRRFLDRVEIISIQFASLGGAARNPPQARD